MAANVANDNARYNSADNVNGGPSPAALVDDADDGGAGNTSVQVAVVSVISNAAKSSLRAYFEGVNWPLNTQISRIILSSILQHLRYLITRCIEWRICISPDMALNQNASVSRII
jgi:hypothetical protein